MRKISAGIGIPDIRITPNMENLPSPIERDKRIYIKIPLVTEAAITPDIIQNLFLKPRSKLTNIVDNHIMMVMIVETLGVK